MHRKLDYMQCKENGFENSNFVDLDSCFHGPILKLRIIFGSPEFGIGSRFLKRLDLGSNLKVIICWTTVSMHTIY